MQSFECDNIKKFHRLLTSIKSMSCIEQRCHRWGNFPKNLIFGEIETVWVCWGNFGEIQKLGKSI